MSNKARHGDQPGLWSETDGRPRRTAERGDPHRPAPLLPAQWPQKAMEFQELWGIDDVANYLGVPKQTVYSWRQTGYGPKGFRVGKHLRWRSGAVIAWTLGLERAE